MPQSCHEHRMAEFHGLVPSGPIEPLLLGARGRTRSIDVRLAVAGRSIILGQIFDSVDHGQCCINRTLARRSISIDG